MTSSRAGRTAARPRRRPQAADDTAAESARGDASPRLLDQTGLTNLVGYAATRASLQLKKSFSRHLGPLDLKAVEYSVMVVVANNDDVNQKQICDALELSPPNLAVLIDRMQQRGLVQRVRGTADRRETYIQLTRPGRDLHRRAVEIAQTMERDALAVLKPAERRQLLQLLLRVGGLASGDEPARRPAAKRRQPSDGARARSSA